MDFHFYFYFLEIRNLSSPTPQNIVELLEHELNSFFSKSTDLIEPKQCMDNQVSDT